MPRRLLVLGAGGHAKVVIDILLSSGCNVVGCYDDDESLEGTKLVGGVRVLGGIDLARRDRPAGCAAVVAIGDNAARRRVALRWEGPFGKAFAPSAVRGRGVAIGPGSMIMPSATINTDAEVGRHVILNTSCSVDHDCRVGDLVHIAPGCRLGGGVTVEEGAFVGTGAVVLPGVRIGRWSIIGAGAVVTREIPDGCTAVGVPARVIRRREEVRFGA
jgi:sugar O-acyltransferase (sialic acid O-acetyltransferase NeuD family)